MAVVISGGIMASAFLNIIVIPALYLKFGLAQSKAVKQEYVAGQGITLVAAD
jgi:Cu/Ag efflux pump CusA